MTNKRLQMFILPFAGGSAANFKRLAERIDPKVDVVPVEYAGRGRRRKETPPKSFWELFDDAVEYICERRIEDLPFCLMGYSMGTVLAYEMLAQRKITGEDCHFFASAEISPKERAVELAKVPSPTDEMILERAKGLGGLDERLLNNPRFTDIFLKPMIRDYRLFYEYRFKDSGCAVNCNTTFFYSEKDTPLADVEKWEELVEGKTDYYEYGENHFFINQYYKQIANIINEHLRYYL